MRLEFKHPFNSIEAAVSTEELAEFVVISGPNGSGKSNLLESIATGAMSVDGVVADTNRQNLRLFRLNELAVTSEGPQSPDQVSDRWVQVYQQVMAEVQSSLRSRRFQPNSDELNQGVTQELIRQRLLSPLAVRELTDKADKRLIDLTEEDFRHFAPLLPGLRDPFTMGLSELFLSYHRRWISNRFQQFLKERGEFDGEPQTDEQFEDESGPPPWDVLNEVMRDINLGYRFIGPTGTEGSLVYEVKPEHDETGAAITPEHLSSGEKTLVALALSLFTGEQHGESIELPEVLLLDETDASLHPSMVASMLRIIERTFVARYSVKVLLATHSPSTVALAPDEALYEMRRAGTPRLRRCSRDEAMRALTVGVPTLNVKIEDRRQVFVESEYDAECYQELYRLTRHGLDSPFSLEFIPAGKGGRGGCDAVIHLVKSLRDAGNRDVYGIVDRDEREGAPEGIVFLAERDAIENLVLDPVGLGIFLIRERHRRSTDLGLGDDFVHTRIGHSEAAQMVKTLGDELRQATDVVTLTPSSYVGGETLEIPDYWLNIDGHALEARIVNQFTELNRYRTRLKFEVVQRALADTPEWIPSDTARLYRRILEPVLAT